MGVFSCPRPNSSTYIVEVAVSLTNEEIRISKTTGPEAKYTYTSID